MRTCHGLTLLELLAALLVASVLLGIGAPALARWQLDAAMTARVNRLVHGVYFAKHTAHQRRAEIVICKTGQGDRCEHDGAWHDGWLVFENSDRDEPPTLDADEPILLHAAPFANGRIHANRRYFVFRPFEIRSTNGSLLFCDRRGLDHSTLVIVSYTGRPRTVSPGYQFDKTQNCENGS